jgi:hypothetical protein
VSIVSWEKKHAEELQLVWHRIVSGDRIRMYCDYYGGHWIELQPRWRFWVKVRVRLTAAEMFEIRAVLAEGRRIGSRRDNAIA